MSLNNAAVDLYQTQFLENLICQRLEMNVESISASVSFLQVFRHFSPFYAGRCLLYLINPLVDQ